MIKFLRFIIAWIKNLFAKKTMRRKISLYIAEQLVDLDDQAFILFNYTMDDLANPTIVKNSFSQQITLKGTPANNRIFGDYFKGDRRFANTGGETGADFNASQRTPFVIYNEMNEILESGYVKLDSTSRKGDDIEYKVTLYGGLGSFLYSLSYDDQGNKRTLADLDYLGTDNSETELNFYITKEAVRGAWQRLAQDQTQSPIWDIINFAPAYNGIPEGNFSPDKGLVDPSVVGLRATIGSYTTKNGYALVNLAQAHDEWAVKDLRSYLQRPIFSIKAFWDAISNPTNNGGYEVDASIPKDMAEVGRYSGMWMTLPMLTSIGTNKQISGDLSLNLTYTTSSANNIARYDIQGSVPAGSKITANINCRIRFNVPSAANAYSTLYNSATYGRTTKGNILFIQAVAYASDNTIMGGSKIKVFGHPSGSLSTLANACGFTPLWNADYESFGASTKYYTKVYTGVFEIPTDLGLTIEAQDAAYYIIYVYRYAYETKVVGGKASTSYSGGSTCMPSMYYSFATSYDAISGFVVSGAVANEVTYTTTDSLRSGALITKGMLLQTPHTPADYLLSLCKILGLYFTYDPATKKVTILRRNDLYQDETIDLTRRVDISQGIEIQPLVFNAKWYDMILEGAGGEFYDEYLNVEGVEYGIQRVNTGYDFNSDSVNLMDSVVFKNACTILARSRYFNYIFTSYFQPSPFLDKGNTYTLWSSAGETLDTDISCPPINASVTYYNTNADYKGYDKDYSSKLELRSADNKPIDGSEILVFLDRWNDYNYFKLSDDIPAMDTLNDGVPCWLLAPGGTGHNALNIPIFSRYGFEWDTYHVEDSLDFGIPRQLNIPGVTIDDTCSLYPRAWKKYLSDRYDVNTKVMKCKVDFSGIQVGQGLLRKFYWYDNSLWVLNKITNYSLTTYDPVECEFVQVQDKDNYLNGQTY